MSAWFLDSELSTCLISNLFAYFHFRSLFPFFKFFLSSSSMYVYVMYAIGANSLIPLFHCSIPPFIGSHGLGTTLGKKNCRRLANYKFLFLKMLLVFLIFCKYSVLFNKMARFIFVTMEM